jgi:hypothetical protein
MLSVGFISSHSNTKFPSLQDVLNSDFVPDTVLSVKSIVLFVSVAVALFFVASDVLSTFHNHTCDAVTL